MQDKRLMLAAIIQANDVLLDDLRKIHEYSKVNYAELIPRINLGRQTGHTSALQLVIEHNPDKHFVVTGMMTSSFDMSFRQCKNVTHVVLGSPSTFDRLRGRRYDAILIDNGTCIDWSYFNEFASYLSSNIQAANAKIFMVG